MTYEAKLTRPKTDSCPTGEETRLFDGPIPSVGDLLRMPGGYEYSYWFVFKVTEVMHLSEKPPLPNKPSVTRVVVTAVFKDVFE